MTEPGILKKTTPKMETEDMIITLKIFRILIQLPNMILIPTPIPFLIQISTQILIQFLILILIWFLITLSIYGNDSNNYSYHNPNCNPNPNHNSNLDSNCSPVSPIYPTYLFIPSTLSVIYRTLVYEPTLCEMTESTHPGSRRRRSDTEWKKHWSAAASFPAISSC